MERMKADKLPLDELVWKDKQKAADLKKQKAAELKKIKEKGSRLKMGSGQQWQQGSSQTDYTNGTSLQNSLRYSIEIVNNCV